MGEQKQQFSEMQALDKSAIARERIDAQEEMQRVVLPLNYKKLKKIKKWRKLMLND